MTDRLLSHIAAEIARDWRPVNYAAKPYLEAMFCLASIRDPYFDDSGVSVVSYFLANATTWRGDTARRVKAELRAMVTNARAAR